jgi:hypothetical protein
VVVSVPRQTGKTTLIHAMSVQRAAVLGSPVFYTAQTGKDARERWSDLVKAANKSPVWRGRTTTTLRGGSECLTFLGHAGVHCFAPTEDCLHGYTPKTVVLDEAFAHNAAKGDMLMGAIDPAQQTILDRQLWIVSTMGTAESTFLHNWIELGLEREPRVALFLWGAPDDHAPFSLEGITGFHPGVGFWLNEKILTAEEVLSKSGKHSRAEYVRAFGNRRTLTSSNLIPVDVWRDLADHQLQPPADTRDITLTYDVSLDGLSSAIVATWKLDDGRVAGKVVQAGPGTSWLTLGVDSLIKAWRPAEVAAADNGPVLDVTAQLGDLGHDVTTVGGNEYAAASGAMLAKISQRRLVHDGGDALEVSATGLVVRPGAVDGVAFSRRHSVGDSSCGIALALGLWVTDRRGQSKPMIYFAS